jgi:hypothetical protein
LEPITLAASTYEETDWLVETGKGEQFPRAGLEHHELQSFVRFFYKEIREYNKRI